MSFGLFVASGYGALGSLNLSLLPMPDHHLRSTLHAQAYAPRAAFRRRTSRWLLCIVGAATTVVLAIPQLALAHAKLRSSRPAANSTIVDTPKELRLTFTEKPEIAVSRVILLAAGKDTVATGKPSADATSAETMVVPVTGRLEPGSYTVRYRVAGRDGHPIAGVFAFTLGNRK